jgi:hypothetical protein
MGLCWQACDQEEHIGFYPIGVKYSGGQSKNGIQVNGSKSFLRAVSPASPSNKTLSGTTTAACPVLFSMVWVLLHAVPLNIGIVLEGEADVCNMRKIS